MSLAQFNWSRFIAEMSDIPPDVIFQIVENGELYEIEGHKIVVGMVSPTFKLMFYTTEVGDKTAQKIKVQETTRPAFQIIIDDLYKIKPIEDSLKDKPLPEVFDVINLLERYQMADLQKVVNELLSNYPVTDDTVMEVAAEALHQSSLFQKEAQILLVTCAKFLKPKLKDAQSIFKFVEENEDQKEVVASLLARMRSLPSTECSNCGYEECQDGKEVKAGKFRVGLLVTNNPAANSTYWGHEDYGTGTVTATKVTVGGVQGTRWNNDNNWTERTWVETAKGFNLFTFVCK